MLILFRTGGEVDVLHKGWAEKKEVENTFSLFLFSFLSMFHRPT